MPRAASDSILYEFDRVEDAIREILVAAVPADTPVYGKRDTRQDVTPYINLRFLSGEAEGTKFARLSSDYPSNVQPDNVFEFSLEVDVVTSRLENNASHSTLAGIVGAQLSFYMLAINWNATVAPYHSISSIKEAGRTHTADSDNGLDTTTLRFTGLHNIRDDAWPLEIA